MSKIFFSKVFSVKLKDNKITEGIVLLNNAQANLLYVSLNNESVIWYSNSKGIGFVVNIYGSWVDITIFSIILTSFNIKLILDNVSLIIHLPSYLHWTLLRRFILNINIFLIYIKFFIFKIKNIYIS